MKRKESRPAYRKRCEFLNYSFACGRKEDDTDSHPFPSRFTADSAQSNQTNKSRLEILQTREQHLQELFDGAKERLAELTKDQGKYTELLKGLILQVREADDEPAWQVVNQAVCNVFCLLSISTGTAAADGGKGHCILQID
jgi:hypothetical protein